MGKYLGLDYGEKRVGVALTDEDKKFAFAETTLQVKDEKDLLSQIMEICRAEKIELIVLGWPLSLAGEKTPQTIMVEKFAGLIKKFIAVKCDFQDERFTSRMSYNLFQKKNRKSKVSKNEINAQSARIILQDYLDRLSLK